MGVKIVWLKLFESTWFEYSQRWLNLYIRDDVEAMYVYSPHLLATAWNLTSELRENIHR
jgi:hypothetical protein